MSTELLSITRTAFGIIYNVLSVYVSSVEETIFNSDGTFMVSPNSPQLVGLKTSSKGGLAEREWNGTTGKKNPTCLPAAQSVYF